MRIFGLDFTSSPSSSTARNPKKLMLASCWLNDGVLSVEQFQLLNGKKKGDFSGFEKWLTSTGDWVAGIDFPFGQPAEFVNSVAWGATWSEYVLNCSRLGKNGFELALTNYKAQQPVGQKELRRRTDRKASSISPMKLFGIPVGKMFFQGSTRLVQTTLSIHPVRYIEGENRTVVEAYPALVARKWNERNSYKNDDPSKCTVEMKESRVNIIKAIRGLSTSLQSPSVEDWYGFRVELNEDQVEVCVSDPTGDQLDSILCAVQAAWYYKNKHFLFSHIDEVNSFEGSIVDPAISIATNVTNN